MESESESNILRQYHNLLDYVGKLEKVFEDLANERNSPAVLALVRETDDAFRWRILVQLDAPIARLASLSGIELDDYGQRGGLFRRIGFIENHE